ncbi:MAG TPA: DUF3014 domain-containing protein [Vicinamibacteria bacterium]|jgi:hypothetical protein|nr:DUF3014 domain-containing protein [Vicinamibacteria bacterium]
MPDLDDFDLDRTAKDAGAPPPPEPWGGPRPALPLTAWVAGLGLLIAGISALLYFFLPRPHAPSPAPPPTPTAASPSPGAPSPESIPLPALDASDALVRELARGLSSSPSFVAWLATRGLIRTAVAVVENVADGETPRPHLGFLAPKAGFRTRSERGRLLVDPKSYEEYDAFADAVDSVDAPGCARALRVLAPLLEAAHKELGHPEGGFPATLERAFVALLQTPVLAGDVPVVRHATTYEFAEGKLEALTPAQKQFLRIGPRNMKKVQAKLRELARALDVPDTRLPPPPPGR